MKCKWCSKKVDKEKLITQGVYYFCSKQHRLDFNREKVRKEKEKVKVRKQKLRIKKANSVSVLTKKADRIASEYTRKRDSMLTTGALTYCICITCGERKEYSQFDCGHFVTRANRATRWEEKNMNAQCKVCNNWGGGRQYEHGKAIDEKYGEGTADKLIVQGKTIFKMHSDFLLEKIEYYTNKLKEYKDNSTKK